MCFTDFIGIRSNCTAVTSESGYYINDLPGISLHTAGDVANEEYANGYDLLSKKIAFASKVAIDEFAAKVKNHLKLAPILEVDRYGKWQEDEYLAVDAGNKGVEICIAQTNLARVHVHKIYVLANTTILNKTISIDHDGTTTNYTVDLAAGVPAEIEIDLTYSGSKITIYWDTSDVAVNDSLEYDTNCRTCGGRSLYKSPSYRYAKVTGLNGTTETTKTYGLSVDFSIVCDSEALLCKLKHKLGLPMLYKAGIEFMKEFQYSTRFNAIAQLHSDEAGELRGLYEAEYNALLNTFADEAAGVLSRMDDDCISCRKTKTITLVP